MTNELEVTESNDGNDADLELFDESGIQDNEEDHNKLEQFLLENNLQEHLTLFRDQEIDFDTLMVLTEIDLKSLGLPLGPFRKLTIALQKKKNGSEADDSVKKADVTVKDTSDLPDEKSFKVVDESGDESDAHSVKSDNDEEKRNESSKREPEKHHPYTYDLLHFKLADEFTGKIELPEPADIEKKTFHMIEDLPRLEDTIKTLRKEKVIAVDAKHVVNFEKKLSLMQISTETTDYLIDFSKMHEYELLMTDIFVNPNILKVFYDAKMGIKFLQKYSCLFTINAYCVRSAVKELKYETFSLYGLINKYVPFVKPKSTECTLRPLSDVLKANLRKETHYLLHLYYKTRNEAIEGGVFEAVVTVGTRVCGYMFVPDEQTKPDSIFKDYDKFNEGQKWAVDKLNQWREYIAQTTDTKTNMVLNVASMRQLSLSLPNSREDLLRVVDTRPVRTHFRKLIGIMKGARRKLAGAPRDEAKYDLKAIKPAQITNWSFRKTGGAKAGSTAGSGALNVKQETKRKNEGFGDGGKRFKRRNPPNRNSYQGKNPMQNPFINSGGFGGGYQGSRMDGGQHFQQNNMIRSNPNPNVWQNPQNQNFNANYGPGFRYY